MIGKEPKTLDHDTRTLLTQNDGKWFFKQMRNVFNGMAINVQRKFILIDDILHFLSGPVPCEKSCV